MLIDSWITVIAYDDDTGRYSIEGDAQVVSETENADVWLVRFPNSETPVRRYIDPQGVALPVNWVDYLNKYTDAADGFLE